MSANKENIINSALRLFNENGLVNVRLQHIADEANVSVGNLAYHFKNKEAIIDTLQSRWMARKEEALMQYRDVPLFDSFDGLIRKLYQLQQSYRFFYVDTLELIRGYTSIGVELQQNNQYLINQIKLILDFNVSRGALRDIAQADYYDQLSHRLWSTIHFWITEQLMRNQDDRKIEEFCGAVWHHLIPLFTEMGRLEYDQMLQRPYDIYFT